MTHTLALLLQRSLEDAGAAPGGGGSVFNTVFIVGFALLISYLALRIARRGGGKKK